MPPSAPGYASHANVARPESHDRETQFAHLRRLPRSNQRGSSASVSNHTGRLSAGGRLSTGFLPCAASLTNVRLRQRIFWDGPALPR